MPLIKYVAWLLGWLMNGIYVVLDAVGWANIGLCIVFFTIIMYIVLTPIQIKQQKSSKVIAVIQPELQQIQKKYQGKKDQASQQKMSEETMALYAKYGVSPTGSCLPLLVQLPILFALYQVILYIPGYVGRVGTIFNNLATKMTGVSGYNKLLTGFVSDNGIRVAGSGKFDANHIIDLLYQLKPSQWEKLKAVFPSLESEIAKTSVKADEISSFLGINITETPWDVIKAGFKGITSGTANGAVIVGLIIGIAIPILAWFTQWINMKLMPQQGQTTDGDKSSVANQMNTMNTIMPVFSALICMTFNMGIGIYWIAGAVVRGVQQVVINRSIGTIDTEEMIRKADAILKEYKETHTGWL
jgi:YidC/Oxa1 family membrane protein insertase